MSGALAVCATYSISPEDKELFEKLDASFKNQISMFHYIATHPLEIGNILWYWTCAYKDLLFANFEASGENLGKMILAMTGVTAH